MKKCSKDGVGVAKVPGSLLPALLWTFQRIPRKDPFLSKGLSIYVYLCVYIYVCRYVCMYVCTYV